jgi:hypothetical protein
LREPQELKVLKEFLELELRVIRELKGMHVVTDQLELKELKALKQHQVFQEEVQQELKGPKEEELKVLVVIQEVQELREHQDHQTKDLRKISNQLQTQLTK